MKTINTYLIERLKLNKDTKTTNQQPFREFCTNNKIGTLLVNDGHWKYKNNYVFDFDDCIETIHNDNIYYFELPYKLDKWKNESKSNTLCCVKYDHENYCHSFDIVNKILKNDFKEIDNDSCDGYDQRPGENEVRYIVECIKYEYKKQNNNLVYLIKIDWDNGWKNTDYYLIFEYDFMIDENENN